MDRHYNKFMINSSHRDNMATFPLIQKLENILFLHKNSQHYNKSQINNEQHTIHWQI